MPEAGYKFLPDSHRIAAAIDLCEFLIFHCLNKYPFTHLSV